MKALVIVVACGMKDHWSRTCRTSKHLVNLYQAFLKGVETNFTEQSDPLGIAHLEAHLGGENQIGPLNSTHMEVADFFVKMAMWRWSNLVVTMPMIIR